MENSLKNKNILVIVFEILIIVLSVVGITFAAQKIINDRTSTLLTGGEYNVEYVGDTLVNANGLEPISDELINYDTRDNVVRVEFSLRGASTNKENNLIYDVMLSDMNIDCSLISKYTKWNLYKNGKLISNGSMDPEWDGSVLTENMKLTNIQEDLPRYNQEYDNYVLLFWISEACDNLETCKLIDQSSILDSKMSMKVFIAVYSGEKVEAKRVPNYDYTCANKPELYDNMIPVNYRDGEWVVADQNNSNKDNLWYDYNAYKWANAVVVKNNKYNEVGTVIDKKDVLGYFVWIPRFRYKLWNVEENIKDSYNAYDEGIDIVFENGLSKVVNSENNRYLTHPVFGDNLRGIWISKYEISKDNNEYKFISDVEGYYDDTVENYANILNDIANSYKLGDKVKSSMISNLAWGATLYLSHSKYGVCGGDGCSSIGMNNSYVSGYDKMDTTTRNVYGIYDMAGGSGEYVLGKSVIGTATSEVILENGYTWYQGLGFVSDRDYIIRGGLERGMFYFGDMNMSPVKNSTRALLTVK